MDAARAETGSVDRNRRVADDDERGVRSRGDARSTAAAARSSGGRGWRAAAHGAAALAVHQRAVRSADARRLSRRRWPKASRTWRSAICFSRTCGSIARNKLAGTGLTPLFPIWGIPTDQLAAQMVEGGLRSVLTCVNPKHLDRSFAGRQFDRALLDDLPAGVDKCGERGEFHSFAWDGPMFNHPVPSRSARSSTATGSSLPTYPERIVCLTEETTETLYLLGEGHRVVGISGYTLRPPEARSKPKVSSFISARFEKIEALEPDLILTFSDLQAGIASELVKRGLPVFAFNQRSVADILQMIRVLAGIVGCEAKGRALAASSSDGLDTDSRPRRSAFPIAAAGVFRRVGQPAHLGHPVGRRAGRNRWRRADLSRAERQTARERSHRRMTTKCCAATPDVILASWCGKKMKKSTIMSRAGWDGSARRSARSHLRDPVDLHPSAGPGRAHRRRADDLRASGVDVC